MPDCYASELQISFECHANTIEWYWLWVERYRSLVRFVSLRINLWDLHSTKSDDAHHIQMWQIPQPKRIKIKNKACYGQLSRFHFPCMRLQFFFLISGYCHSFNLLYVVFHCICKVTKTMLHFSILAVLLSVDVYAAKWKTKSHPSPSLCEGGSFK